MLFKTIFCMVITGVAIRCVFICYTLFKRIFCTVITGDLAVIKG